MGVSRHRSERFLRGLFETGHADPAMLLSPVRDAWERVDDLRFELVNDGAAEWIGLPAGLLVGRTMRQVFSPEELSPLMPALLRVSETGAPWEDPDFLTPDGSRRLSIRAVAVEDHVGLTFRFVPPSQDPVAAHGASEIEALRRVAAAVGAGLSKDEVFRLAGDVLEDLYGAGNIALAQLEIGSIAVVASTLDPRPSLEPGPMPLAEVLRTGRSVRCDDLSAVDDPLARDFVRRGLVAAVASPIRIGRRQWGGIAFAAPRAAPPTAELTLETLGALMGIMLRDLEARRRDPTRRTTDNLTGLPDHAAFRERLAEEWETALRNRLPLALAVFDIDRFADVNARVGHREGDAVLVEIADRLRALAGDPDDLARIGGEEFAWILPGLDVDGALQIAGRVREAVSGTPFGIAGEITVSGGVADIGQASRPTELLRLAEGAMSWAKTHGRDLVLAYDATVVAAFSAAEWAERLERDKTLASIEALARVVDAKDHNTHEHSERVAGTAGALARELGWDEERLLLLREVARVHDVGKIGVPDEILAKPTRLTRREYERVRGHAERGADIVSGVLTPEQVSWVRHHHERWDGTGYPDGLTGEEIPEGARILALVDAVDVMLGNRRYTTGRPLTDVLEECRRCSGTQFWPRAVDALIRLYEELPPPS
ncbi:MAG: HD domain-containing phosphohydrolase [Actinomycetota bacterium]